MQEQIHFQLWLLILRALNGEEISLEEFKEIVLRDKEKRLSISRVPKKTKEEFVAFANEEFEEDYGMCLKYVWDNFKMWKMFFENTNFKLDNIIELISQPQPTNQPEQKGETISLLSGKKIEKGGKS